MPIVRDFPLFPLGLVALPSELIPLHIFEERYKTMIGRCRQEGTEFGIVWMADDGLRQIGCACEIAEVLEELDDGRINLVVRGTRPFRIEAARRSSPTPPARSSSSPTATRSPTPTPRARRTRPTRSSSARRPTATPTRASSPR